MVKKPQGRKISLVGNENPTRSRLNYRPVILRLYALVFGLALTLALIGILEWANRTAPGTTHTVPTARKLRIRDEQTLGLNSSLPLPFNAPYSAHKAPELRVRDDHTPIVLPSPPPGKSSLPIPRKLQKRDKPSPKPSPLRKTSPKPKPKPKHKPRTPTPANTPKPSKTRKATRTKAQYRELKVRNKLHDTTTYDVPHQTRKLRVRDEPTGFSDPPESITSSALPDPVPSFSAGGPEEPGSSSSASEEPCTEYYCPQPSSTPPPETSSEAPCTEYWCPQPSSTPEPSSTPLCGGENPPCYYETSSSIFEPTSSVFEPSSSVFEPSSSAFEPSSSIFEPSSSTPESSSSPPETSSTPSCGGGGENPPCYETSSSIFEPSSSTFEPTSSVYEPSSSTFEPSSSTFEPSSSIFEPSSSIFEPSSSVFEPSSSIFEPSSSIFEPSSSIFEPSSSIFEPSSSTPEPSSSTPEPSSSTPEPSSSTPEPSSTSVSWSTPESSSTSVSISSSTASESSYTPSSSASSSSISQSSFSPSASSTTSSLPSSSSSTIPSSSSSPSSSSPSPSSSGFPPSPPLPSTSSSLPPSSSPSPSSSGFPPSPPLPSSSSSLPSSSSPSPSSSIFPPSPPLPSFSTPSPQSSSSPAPSSSSTVPASSSISLAVSTSSGVPPLPPAFSPSSSAPPQSSSSVIQPSSSASPSSSFSIPLASPPGSPSSSSIPIVVSSSILSVQSVPSSVITSSSVNLFPPPFTPPLVSNPGVLSSATTSSSVNGFPPPFTPPSVSVPGNPTSSAPASSFTPIPGSTPGVLSPSPSASTPVIVPPVPVESTPVLSLLSTPAPQPTPVISTPTVPSLSTPPPVAPPLESTPLVSLSTPTPIPPPAVESTPVFPSQSIETPPGVAPSVVESTPIVALSSVFVPLVEPSVALPPVLLSSSPIVPGVPVVGSTPVVLVTPLPSQTPVESTPAVSGTPISPPLIPEVSIPIQLSTPIGSVVQSTNINLDTAPFPSVVPSETLQTPVSASQQGTPPIGAPSGPVQSTPTSGTPGVAIPVSGTVSSPAQISIPNNVATPTSSNGPPIVIPPVFVSESENPGFTPPQSEGSQPSPSGVPEVSGSIILIPISTPGALLPSSFPADISQGTPIVPVASQSLPGAIPVSIGSLPPSGISQLVPNGQVSTPLGSLEGSTTPVPGIVPFFVGSRDGQPSIPVGSEFPPGNPAQQTPVSGGSAGSGIPPVAVVGQPSQPAQGVVSGDRGLATPGTNPASESPVPLAVVNATPSPVNGQIPAAQSGNPQASGNPTQSQESTSATASNSPQAQQSPATVSQPASTPTGTSRGGNQGDPTLSLPETGLVETSKEVLVSIIPVLVAKIFTMFLSAGVDAVHDMAPFIGLASPDGASASILTGGIAFLGGLSIPTLHADIANAAALLLPIFASDTLFLEVPVNCPEPCLRGANIMVNTWAIRVLQALLSVIAVMIAVHILRWFRRPSGIAADPTSIAATAAIMGHPQVMREFGELDHNMTSKELEKALDGKEYRLDDYTAENGAVRFGLVPLHAAPDATDGAATGNTATDAALQENPDAPDPADAISSAAGPSGTTATRGLADTPDAADTRDVASATADSTALVAAPVIVPSKPRGWWSLRWTDLSLLADILFAIFLAALLGIVASYVHEGANSPFARWWAHASYGKGIIFTLFGIIVNTRYGQLQKDLQTLTPYWELQQHESHPAPTILLRRWSLPIASFFPLLKRRHFIAATVVFTAFWSEFIVVTLCGVSHGPGRLPKLFYVCGIFTIVLLALMILVLFIMHIWKRALPNIPRKPNSIAAVIMHVYDSKMCDDFEGTEELTTRERDERIKALNKQYYCGVRQDTQRWIVDEIPTAEKTRLA